MWRSLLCQSWFLSLGKIWNANISSFTEQVMSQMTLPQLQRKTRLGSAERESWMPGWFDRHFHYSISKTTYGNRERFPSIYRTSFIRKKRAQERGKKREKGAEESGDVCTTNAITVDCRVLELIRVYVHTTTHKDGRFCSVDTYLLCILFFFLSYEFINITLGKSNRLKTWVGTCFLISALTEGTMLEPVP